MLELIRSKRYTAGNICLVLFVAFLLSIFTGNVGNVDTAFAAESSPSVSATWSSDREDLIITLDPVTPNTFVKAVFTDLNLEVYKDNFVLNAVYKFVYTIADAFQLSLPAYVPVYVYFDGSVDPYSVTLTVPERPPNPDTPSSSGGGGGGGVAPNPPFANETGTATVDEKTGAVTLKVDNTKVTSQLKQGATVTIQVPTTTATKKAVVETSSSLLTQAATAGATLAVKLTADTQIAITPTTFDQAVLASLGADAKIEMEIDTTEEVAGDSVEGEQKVVSRIYNVSFTATKADGTKVVLTPANPLAMTFTYDTLPAAQVEAQKADFIKNTLQVLGLTTATGSVDEEKLGVYKYDEATKKWVYVGGKVDTTTKAIDVKLTSFGKYSIMAFDKKFTDVPTTYWANREVEILAAKHIAKGYGDLFKPEASITRGDFTVLLMRALGYAEVQGNTFTDVTEAYNKGYIEAAFAAGIVNGYGAEFKPNQNITREEMAVIIARAMTKQGYVSDATATELDKFVDKTSIGGYAVEGVAISAKAGIVLGKHDGSFDPSTNATRAQTIVMLKRCLTALDEI